MFEISSKKLWNKSVWNLKEEYLGCCFWNLENKTRILFDTISIRKKITASKRTSLSPLKEGMDLHKLILFAKNLTKSCSKIQS